MQILVMALSERKINCDTLASLLLLLYAYSHRSEVNPNVNAVVIDVHGHGHPVFLPAIKIVKSGLIIEKNVEGLLSGVFFDDGHRVASLGGVCYDLITGNKGSLANMLVAYKPCTEVTPTRFSFVDAGVTRLLDVRPNSFTPQSLAKFTCT